MKEQMMPKQYDKTCMRCDAPVMCFQKEGVRDIYDKINHVFVQDSTPIEKCPIRMEIFSSKPK